MLSRLMPPTEPLATTFADLLGRPVRMEPVPRETWESLFHARFDWGFDLRRNRPRSRVNFNSETDFTEADFWTVSLEWLSVAQFLIWTGRIDSIAERIQLLGGVSIAMAPDVAETTRLDRPPSGGQGFRF